VKLGRPNHSSVVTACQRLTKQIEAGAGVSLAPGEPPVLLSDLVALIETDLQR
jgi:alkanesulfonate monooxygenase SsuD/methylene tetrahydromethanopterin reductase-like flavin-dependent oxidoreductase (luciferase family)